MHTRSKSTQGNDHIPSCKELTRINQNALTSATQAHEYLEKQGYALPDANGSRASLSYTLLLLTHCAPSNTLPKGVGAVVTLLEHEEARRTSDRIISAIMCRLDPKIDSLEQVADLAQKAVGETRRGADCLYRTSKETRDELQSGLEVQERTYNKQQIASWMGLTCLFK